ncbi:hypothetical protein APHAL10511_003471 [Amanita phalloides]|nr:hypothetical protein APHAL10511_003471 [Amanita phalloides]
MKFSLRAVVGLVSLLCPLSVLAGHPELVTFSRRTSTTAGAAYFMSNEPTGNYLFALDIGLDGKLTLRRGYFTGGKGDHGTGLGTDALFSQNSIITSKEANVLIVVNAGSNTLTTYSVNPNEPTELTMLGSPVNSGGEFPVSVAISSTGDRVCALNGGAVNGVSCFKLDKAHGLTPLPNTTRSLSLPQTTPPKGIDGTVGQVLFRTHDTQLSVTVKGHNDTDPFQSRQGYLAVWSFEKDGSLSNDYVPVVGGIWGWSMNDVPNHDRVALLVGDAAFGVDIFIEEPNGVALKQVKIPGQGAICWGEYSNATGNFYLTDFFHSTIYEINIDKNFDTKVLEKFELDKNDGPIDFSIAHISGKDRIYVLAPNNTAVEVIELNAPGQMQRIQKLDIGTPIRAAGLPLNPINSYGFATFTV